MLFNYSGAIFSDCRMYRYVLWRIWDESRPMIAFVGLNPSRATEEKNDPTIRRVIGLARSWGYGGVYMLNLFAFITPYPQELSAVSDPVGENDSYLIEYSKKCERVVMAYGAFTQARERAALVQALLPASYALKINADGSPKHPLYVKNGTELIPFVYEKTVSRKIK